MAGFTQSRDHILADLCIYCTVIAACISAPLAAAAALASSPSRRWYFDREKARVRYEVNKRKNLIRKDELLRHGEEELPRRSQFTDW